MKHIITGVVSVGHFDNFCCWQYGQDSSAHKDGINIMLDEIAALSHGYADHGRVEVSVVGGYTDARGDAAKNSLSLLHALQDDKRLLELKHFCVGKFNTTDAEKGDNLLSTDTTAIIKGIAVDLKTQQLFPATFEWGNYDDFKLQLKDRMRMKVGQDPMDSEEANKTADSTFKPKSLRNKANHDYLVDKVKKEMVPEDREEEDEEVKPRTFRRNGKILLANNTSGFEGLPFKVKLRPTVINDKSAVRKRKVKKRNNSGA